MDTTSESKQVADTIIAQMGGRKIFAMAFRSAVRGERNVTLRIARGLRAKGGATHVSVTLDASDTYTVKTVKMYGQVVEEMSDVYCDSLRSVVESMTGLALSLGTMGR